MRLADASTLVRWFAADLRLDLVQRADALERFCRDRRLPHDMQVVQFATGVGHAGRFLDSPALVKLGVAGKGIRLQHALEVRQVTLRVFTAAIRRIGKPDCGRFGRARGPIVAHVDPETPGLGLTITRREHRQRRVIAMDLDAAEHVSA
ncbi:hypothetical protein WL16_32205 [Burkholderia ubonensis]|nr:hypothetical protein WL16_32205 [Burkholderia ubonensis]